MRLKSGRGFGRKRGGGNATLGGEAGQEVIDEFRDIFAALLEGRHPHRDDVETVEEILAKTPRGNLVGEVARSRREEADVDLDRTLAANARVALIGQNAQDLALGRQRHVGDLVEEQRATMRLFEQSGSRLAVAFRAKQFLLDAVRAHHRCGQDDERRIGAGAPVMDRARGDFLADARGSSDHHAASGRCHSLERRAHRVDRDRGAIERVVIAEPLAQRRVLAAKALGLGRASHEMEQARGFERLLDEVDRAFADCGHRSVEVSVAGDHDDGQRGVAPLDLFEDLQPVEFGSLEPDVEQHERRPPLLDRVERTRAVGSSTHGVTFILEHAGDKVADVGFIVDDEHFKRHFQLPYLRACGGRKGPSRPPWRGQRGGGNRTQSGPAFHRLRGLEMQLFQSVPRRSS